jgi:hypothetical protein
MQASIRDPAIASWDEALNSPELEIENRLKRISNIDALAISGEDYVNIFDLNSHFLVQSSIIRHLFPILSSFLDPFRVFLHSFR